MAEGDRAGAFAFLKATQIFALKAFVARKINWGEIRKSLHNNQRRLSRIYSRCRASLEILDVGHRVLKNGCLQTVLCLFHASESSKFYGLGRNLE